VDLPPELRTSGPERDDKIVNEDEERRLFYVAMTRARDTLAIYTKQGTAKKDPTPTKFLREFMPNPAYKNFWRSRPAAAVQDDLFAEEAKIPIEHSNVAAWLLTPPSANFFTGLSASAITTYEGCPLRFKLEREWNLPHDVPATLHYGAVMHSVLRTYYDARRFGRVIADSDLLEMMRKGLVDAGIADRYQYELYLKQGTEQLRQFLELARTTPQPEVLQTEQTFDLQVGETKLRGRVDRIDRLASGAVAIVDYKTGKPKSQEDADDSLQLSLYALAAREVWGHDVAQLTFYNLENNTAITTTRNDAQLEEARVRVQEVAEDIAEGKFDAKPGYQCVFCPYRNLCPATEKVIFVTPKKAARAN
jgi:RecB family exonuclease